MQAIILSRRDMREHDQIISLYTLEKGKVEALARGVKKILSKNAAHLEPFCLVEAEIIPGKKELAHLGSVVSINIFKNIRADLGKSVSANFTVKLLDKVIHPGQPDKKLFSLLQRWLEYLDTRSFFVREGENGRLYIDAFVSELLKLLGFGEENIFADKSWEEVSLMKFDKKLHDKIYHDLVFHTEAKVKDWI